MKKNILLVCAAIMLALCFSATNALAIKDQCIELCTTESGDNGTDCSLVWLDSDGWFEVVDGDLYYDYGDWAHYGGSFVMQFTYGCSPIFAGTKKRGFFECAGGQYIPSGEPAAKPAPEGFNTYTIKKIKRKHCEEMMHEK